MKDWMRMSLVLLVALWAPCTVVSTDPTQRGRAHLEEYPEVKNIARDFGVGGKHGTNRPDLWLVGAGQIIPQFNRLIDFVSPDYNMETLSVEEGHHYFQMKKYRDKVNMLGNILAREGSDKSVFYQHYHHVYTYIFEDLLSRKSKLRTLEIGMGTNNTQLVSTMGARGRPGASLFAFSKYLRDSDIFGADIDKDILFQSEKYRIRTTFIDGYNYSTYEDLYRTFGSQPFDLIIDDAAHAVSSDLNTLLFALNHINVPGWIVIEDLNPAYMPSFRLIDYLLKSRVGVNIDIHSTLVFTAHRRHGKGNPDPNTKTLIYVVNLMPKS